MQLTKYVLAVVRVSFVTAVVSAGCSGTSGTAPDATGTGGSGGMASTGTGGSNGTGGAGTGGAGGAVSGSGGGVTPADAAPDSSGPEAGPADMGVVAGDTWETFGKGFFATYCVSCHNDDNSGSAARDYHVLGNVVKEKVAIACGSAKSAADRTSRGCPAGSPAARQFPVGGGPKPSDADRDRLLKWIDSGAM